MTSPRPHDRRRSGRARRAPAIALALAAMLGGAAPAAAYSARDDAAVAGFLHKIARFILWPDRAFEGPDAPVRLCAAPETALVRMLAPLHGATLPRRAVAVAHMARPWAAGCHLVFLSTETADLDAAIEEAGRHVALVSDAPDFVARGGMVGVSPGPGGLGFAVNAAAAHRAGLVVSSRLLKLADQVSP